MKNVRVIFFEKKIRWPQMFQKCPIQREMTTTKNSSADGVSFNGFKKWHIGPPPLCFLLKSLIHREIAKKIGGKWSFITVPYSSP